MRLFKNVRWTAEYIPLKNAVGVEALLSTQKSLNKNEDNMMETIGLLQERLDSIISNTDPDRKGEPLRLQEELTSLEKYLEVCNKASNLLSNQELNIGGDVIADRDCYQIVVTPLADLFHPRMVEATSRSAQLVGSVPVDVLLDLSKGRYSSRFGAQP
jgi:hypothetical protein